MFFEHKTTALVLVMALIAGILSLSGAAAAQEVEVNQSTPEPAIEGTVGPVEIMDYRAEDGTMVLTVRSENHVAYALSDALAGLRSEGVTSVPVKKGTISPGKTKLRLDVTTYQGAAGVTLATPQDAARIQTDAVDSGAPPVPFSQAALAVLAAAIGTGWLSFRRARAKLQESDDPEVNRIA